MTEPFYFADGQLAYSAEDLLELCRKFPDDGSNYLVREDLEKWLTYIGKEDIAQCAASARQTALDERQKLDEFLAKCHALSSVEAESAPEALQSTTVEETKPEPMATETTPAKLEPTVQPVATETTPAKPEPTIQPVATETTPAKPEPTVQPVATETTPAKPKSTVQPVATETTPAKPKSTVEASPSNSTEKKPTFLRAIARLVVNVLDRNKN